MITCSERQTEHRMFMCGHPHVTKRSWNLFYTNNHSVCYLDAKIRDRMQISIATRLAYRVLWHAFRSWQPYTFLHSVEIKLKLLTPLYNQTTSPVLHRAASASSADQNSQTHVSSEFKEYPKLAADSISGWGGTQTVGLCVILTELCIACNCFFMWLNSKGTLPNMTWIKM